MRSHVSALELDELALGVSPAGAREHLDSCVRCRADYDAAAGLREHFVAHVLPRTSVPRRRRWSWLALLAVPMLAAAAAGVWLVISPHRAAPTLAPERPPVLAIKGDATWQVFANRDGHTFAVHDGTQLEAGDRIRFAVTPDGARYLLIVSIDGAGTASIYVPYGGNESAPLDADLRVELPGSIVLDAAPGPERLFALFSDEPIGTAAVTDQLHAIGAGGVDAIRAAGPLAVAARAQLTLVFEKAAP